ncbi:MAG: TerB family tellurite resistance protein [Halioglobus sp.]|nr:TerB family tellurite resistance protein [Halioglobus sp.]
MIRSLKALFEAPQHKNAKSPEPDLRLAAAALLVETARADFTEDDVELTKLAELLKASLKLEQSEIDTLVLNARERVEEATSLYDLTKVINEHCSADQKLQLINAMWIVAYADGNLSKYEEHLIRQVADLTYVSHSDYINCKLSANR